MRRFVRATSAFSVRLSSGALASWCVLAGCLAASLGGARAAGASPATAPAPTTRPTWIGVNRFMVMPSSVAELMKMDPNSVAVVAFEIVPGQPAAKAGLRERDIVVALDGKPLPRGTSDDLTLRGFVDLILARRVGDRVALTVRRDRALREVTVEVVEMPMPPVRFADLGLTLREIRGPAGSHPAQEGPTVIVVSPDRPGARAGFQVGDVIVSLGGKAVSTMDEVLGAFTSFAGAGGDLDVKVSRDGKEQALTLHLPAPPKAPTPPATKPPAGPATSPATPSDPKT